MIKKKEQKNERHYICWRFWYKNISVNEGDSKIVIILQGIREVQVLKGTFKFKDS